MTTRIALVPGVLALLPQYASIEDPIAELRAAVAAAVAWLGDEVEILASDQGRRVAEAVLAARPTPGADPGAPEERGERAERAVLVVLNGSACRTERAPGFLDERAEAFDEALGGALAAPSPERLREVDRTVAAELWADVAALPQLADLLEGLLKDLLEDPLAGVRTAGVDYDDAPFGVQYWVMRWEG